MSLFELFILSFVLGFDACVVAFSYGMKCQSSFFKKAFSIAFFTALFQFLMPLIGAVFTNIFIDYIRIYANYFAGGIFIILGIKFFNDKTGEEIKPEKESKAELSLKTLLLISVSTSVDALAAGGSLQLLNVNIIKSAMIIGIITFIMAFFGFALGETIKNINKNAPDLFNKSGAIILILLGLKTIFL